MQRHYDADQREAIETFEKHQLNVGFIVADLPKDQKNNELKDCVEAYITLAKQNLPFVLINSDNVSTSGIYFSGQRGKRDHNKYKIIIKRNLD